MLENKPLISIIIPVYNERKVINELVKRVVSAVEQTGLEYELIIVNDCSTDGTDMALTNLAAQYPSLNPLLLRENRGQWGATMAGIEKAEGDYLAVLDGDLQDPPEVLTDLVNKMLDSKPDVVFAVKARRYDTKWMKRAAAGYHWLMEKLSPGFIPGAGSFCIFKKRIRPKILTVKVKSCNLAGVLTAVPGKYETLDYVKGGRYDDKSRVGFWGLCREAVSTMLYFTALPRYLLGLVIVLFVFSILLHYIYSFSVILFLLDIVLIILGAFLYRCIQRTG